MDSIQPITQRVLRFSRWAVALLLLSATAAQGAIEKSTTEFPYRSQYDIQILETQDLAARLNAVLVVDVRSKYEYDTLHVKGAINVSLDSKDFITDIRKLREGDARPIVFYCNGKTCRKSYDAAARAGQAGILNVYAYDAGILVWAEAYTGNTVLRGKTPIQSSDLISEQDFTKHVLAPRQFTEQYERLGNKAVALDIRDRAQRDNPVFGPGEVRVPLDDSARLDGLIDMALKHHSTLLIYDKAGHQIRWFQYYLREKGLQDYYFLKGGSDGYFAETLGLRQPGKK